MMKQKRISVGVVVATLCLAAAMVCSGCSAQPDPTPEQPASPSSGTSDTSGNTPSGNPSNDASSKVDSSSQETESKPLTYEEKLYQALYQNAKHPANEQPDWIRKDGQIYVAHVSQSGRLSDGEWKTYDEAANYSVSEDVYEYCMKTNGMCWGTFFAVPDDSVTGSNCVWDGTNLNYYPTNVNDKNTYFYWTGHVYECYISPDGYLYGGGWMQVNMSHPQKYHTVSFDSFPYNTTCAVGYHWDGVKLTYEPVHKVSSADVMTIGESDIYETGSTNANGTYIMGAKVAPDGRILDTERGWTLVMGSKEEAEEYRKQQGYNVCFYEAPIYGSMTDYIWDGSTFTYSYIQRGE